MALTEAEELELLTLERERGSAPQKVATAEKPKPTTGVGKVREFVENLPRPPVRPSELNMGSALSFAHPLLSKTAGILENAGEDVNRSVQGVAGRVAESGNPYSAMMMGMLGDVGKLTPSNASLAVGAESLPMLAVPWANRAERIAKSVGNKFLGTPVKSLAKSIGGKSKTLGERFLQETQLPANREEAFSESSQIISDYEGKIQKMLDDAVFKGKQPNVPEVKVKGTPTITYNPSKAVIPEVMPKGTVLPGETSYGSGIQRFTDATDKTPANVPRVGGGSMVEPNRLEELNLSTKGKLFSKGGSKGIFNMESPDVTGKQAQHTDEVLQDMIMRHREEFARRMSTPEYGFKIPSKWAIGKEKIGSAFDKIIGKFGKTGLEGDSVSKLKGLKEEFLAAHPDTADVHYWNDIKREIYGLVGDRGYLNQNSTAKVKALKAVANAIKDEVERVAPGIKDLNAKQGLYLEIRDALEGTLARGGKNVGASIKGELKDEALVSSARRGLGKNLYKTRGLGGAAATGTKVKREDIGNLTDILSGNQ